MAELLFERMTFSLSTREVDRLLVKERFDAEILRAIHDARILVLRGDRLSFVHEMYLNVFAAEAIVRQVGADVGALNEALVMPRFNELRTFVAGAIEDRKLLAHLLGRTADASLLRACMLGECGIDAQQLIQQALDALIGRLQSEIESVRFFIAADQMWQIGVEPASRATWTEHERTLLSALPAAVMQGRYFRELLDVAGRLDQRLSEEFTRLRSDAVQKGMKMLRSSLFAVAFVFGERDLGISLVMSVLQSGSLTRLSESPERQSILRYVWLNAATPGQFYLALVLSRSALRLEREILELAIQHMLPLLEIQQWKFLPYHLQLELMNFVQFLPREDTPVTQRLAQTLEDLLPNLHPMLQSIAVEALSDLGAMDDELKDHEAHVRREVAQVFDNPGGENAAEIAWNIYSAQFEHPFATAYIDVIEDLSDEQRLTLMRLACAGASEHSFFLGSLIKKLAHAGDLLAVPAISLWARLPNMDSSMRQNAIDVYIAALVALGQLKSDLSPDLCPMGLVPREDAMAACGVIYYWLQRLAADAVAAEPVVTAAFETLSANPALAIGVLSDISRSIMDSEGNGVLLITTFPERAATLARAALQREGPLEGYFSGPPIFGESDAKRFALSTIESYGSADDLPLLRKFFDHVDLSGSARKAVAAIEMRASSGAQGKH